MKTKYNAHISTVSYSLFGNDVGHSSNVVHNHHLLSCCLIITSKNIKIRYVFQIPFVLQAHLLWWEKPLREVMNYAGADAREFLRLGLHCHTGIRVRQNVSEGRIAVSIHAIVLGKNNSNFKAGQVKLD